MRTEIEKLLIDAIEEQNLYLDEPVDLSMGNDAALYSDVGNLDSLSLITIIADIEKHILTHFSVQLRLANERDLNISNSPFSTLGSMLNYIDTKLSATLQLECDVA